MSTTLLHGFLGRPIVDLSRGMTHGLLHRGTRSSLNGTLRQVFKDAFDRAADKQITQAINEEMARRIQSRVDRELPAEIANISIQANLRKQSRINAFNAFNPNDVHAGAKLLLDKLKRQAGQIAEDGDRLKTNDYSRMIYELEQFIRHERMHLSNDLRRKISNAALEHQAQLYARIDQAKGPIETRPQIRQRIYEMVKAQEEKRENDTREIFNVKSPPVKAQLDQGRITIKRKAAFHKTGAEYAQISIPESTQLAGVKSEFPTVLNLTGGDYDKYAASVVEYKTEFYRVMSQGSPYISRELGVSTGETKWPMALLWRLDDFDKIFTEELPEACRMSYGGKNIQRYSLWRKR